MRLDKELGALNREIIGIKEKWKIALNIDLKKVAIEKLITRRTQLRDTEKINNQVKEAIKDEQEQIKLSTSLDENLEFEIVITPHQEESSISQKPAHLTVAWLKGRLKENRKRALTK